MFKSGFVTIVGKSNVGKSTLLNTLIGEKVAIVSNKPQTTRNKIMGVLSKNDYQIVFIDTPGIHNAKNKLSEYMVKSVNEAMKGMDFLCVVLDASYIAERDHLILDNMKNSNCKKCILINKIDLIEKSAILSIIDSLKQYNYDYILPISASKRDGVEELEKLIVDCLPEGPKYFPDDMITDQPERNIYAEIIREKALTFLRDEIPHGIGVEIMKIENLNNVMHIDATIYCEKDSHKGIIIGKKGSMLTKIGKSARLDIEAFSGNKVNLKLWIKVKEDWRNKVSDLNNLGYSFK